MTAFISAGESRRLLPRARHRREVRAERGLTLNVSGRRQRLPHLLEEFRHVATDGVPHHRHVNIPLAVGQSVSHTADLAQRHRWESFDRYIGQIFHESLHLDDELSCGEAGYLTRHFRRAEIALAKARQVGGLGSKCGTTVQQLRIPRLWSGHRNSRAVSRARSAARPCACRDITSTRRPRSSSRSISNPA